MGESSRGGKELSVYMVQGSRGKGLKRNGKKVQNLEKKEERAEVRSNTPTFCCMSLVCQSGEGHNFGGKKDTLWVSH
jgi:hypothetical protein